LRVKLNYVVVFAFQKARESVKKVLLTNEAYRGFNHHGWQVLLNKVCSEFIEKTYITTNCQTA